MGKRGFTLVELLIVIVILAVLLALALPLYSRSVRDSQRQTCRSNMQTIASAEQAFKIRDRQHAYTTDLNLLVGEDMPALPRCPADTDANTPDYVVTLDEPEKGMLTIRCACDDIAARALHNSPTGFIPGKSAE